jgi:hypothetical protein
VKEDQLEEMAKMVSLVIVASQDLKVKEDPGEKLENLAKMASLYLLPTPKALDGAATLIKKNLL